MAEIKFDLESMSFLNNIDYGNPNGFNTIGIQEMIAAAENDPGDHSLIFEALITLTEAIAGESFDLSNIFTVICENGLPTLVLGAIVQSSAEGQPIFSFGSNDSSNHFSLIQVAKELSVGAVRGEIVAIALPEPNNSFYRLEWQVSLESESEEFFYTFRMRLPKVDKKTVHPTRPLISAAFKANNLATLLGVAGTGSGGEAVDGYDLGVGEYEVTGVAKSGYSATPQDWDKTKGLWAILSLADGREVWAEDMAKSQLYSSNMSYTFPCKLKISKVFLSPKSNRKSAIMALISQSGGGKTKLPSGLAKALAASNGNKAIAASAVTVEAEADFAMPF
jgi:hypothetical protein